MSQSMNNTIKIIERRQSYKSNSTDYAFFENFLSKKIKKYFFWYWNLDIDSPWLSFSPPYSFSPLMKNLSLPLPPFSPLRNQNPFFLSYSFSPLFFLFLKTFLPLILSLHILSLHIFSLHILSPSYTFSPPLASSKTTM